VPAVERATLAGKAAQLHVRLAGHELEATDDTGRVIAHFPVSIARNVDKRPVGELHVTVVIPDPNYTFDPEVFPESPEGRDLGHKLIIPPGPNNPVGIAWIGLDRTGYGIHGTPDPEKVGRTESHGCFRLANWDARTLLDIAWTGLPVFVEP
jgi:lipoprotein-anchoring transpeptidase ErfK/SrfK